MGTIKVRMANRILRVSPNELEKYLASGYTIIQEPKTQVKQPSTKVVAEPAKEEPAKPVVEEVAEPVIEEPVVKAQPKKVRTRRRK